VGLVGGEKRATSATRLSGTGFWFYHTPPPQPPLFSKLLSLGPLSCNLKKKRFKVVANFCVIKFKDIAKKMVAFLLDL